MLLVEPFSVNSFWTIKFFVMKLSGKILHQFPRLIKKKPRKKSQNSWSYKLFPVAKKHGFSSVQKKGYKCHFLSQSESRKLTNQISRKHKHNLQLETQIQKHYKSLTWVGIEPGPLNCELLMMTTWLRWHVQVKR